MSEDDRFVCPNCPYLEPRFENEADVVELIADNKRLEQEVDELRVQLLRHAINKCKPVWSTPVLRPPDWIWIKYWANYWK